MKYRPEIDGLRALAVIPVILFHAGFKLFSAGCVGVDDYGNAKLLAKDGNLLVSR